MKKIASYATMLGAAAIHLTACGEQSGADPANSASQQHSPAIAVNAVASNSLAPDTNDPAPAEEAMPEAANDIEPAKAEASFADAAPPAAESPGASGTAAKASPEAGIEPEPVVERPRRFAMCATCHTTGSGEPHRIGPNLFGVVGSKAGSKPGYAYSDAMKNSGITWTQPRLMEYLLAPRDMVPGTKMMIGGPKDEDGRREIVDYLATLK